MVILFLLILLLPVSARAITADELRELSDVWESSERERSERIETGNLNKLIPKKPDKKVLPVDVKKEAPKEAEKPKKKRENNRQRTTRKISAGCSKSLSRKSSTEETDKTQGKEISDEG